MLWHPCATDQKLDIIGRRHRFDALFEIAVVFQEGCIRFVFGAGWVNGKEPVCPAMDHYRHIQLFEFALIIGFVGDDCLEDLAFKDVEVFGGKVIDDFGRALLRPKQ